MDASRLADIELFSQLSRRQRKAVAQHADEISISPGEKVVEEGRLAYELFVLVSGEADVFDGETKIGELGPGDVIGEIGVLDTHKRTATVVATAPIDAIVFYGPELLALRDDVPEVFERLGELARARQEADDGP